MNIVEQAASIAASAWDQDKTYEQAMLETFYQVRGQEMREKKAREQRWMSKIWHAIRRWNKLSGTRC